jgi:hypothetical protein
MGERPATTQGLLQGGRQAVEHGAVLRSQGGLVRPPPVENHDRHQSGKDAESQLLWGGHISHPIEGFDGSQPPASVPCTTFESVHDTSRP